mmetsp:Transcript_19592/g.45550  ORF Transcript_19592/g.45550 Transcript_19592/m.45550 type:complete len:350 (-) Transcript_19592:290-1339(-)
MNSPNQFSLYAALELPKGASSAEIKKAYRRLAWSHHPDKGGSQERFKEISFAYEVLSDPDSRRNYDEKGDRLFYSGPPASAEELAEMLAKGIGGKSARKKSKDKYVPLSVSLEQLYKGCNETLILTRKIVDPDCSVQPCSACGGTGMMPNQVLPLSGSLCKVCAGCGKSWTAVHVKEELHVFVEKGSCHGQSIRFDAKADELPGATPGDIVVVLHELQHPRFTRRGSDLFLKMDITLVEAIAGFRRVLLHLDGRRLVARSDQPLALKGRTSLKVIKGQGMPLKGRPFICGNLFLELCVLFPEKLDASAVSMLQDILPKPEVSEQLAKQRLVVCGFDHRDPSSPDLHYGI